MSNLAPTIRTHYITPTNKSELKSFDFKNGRDSLNIQFVEGLSFPFRHGAVSMEPVTFIKQGSLNGRRFQITGGAECAVDLDELKRSFEDYADRGPTLQILANASYHRILHRTHEREGIDSLCLMRPHPRRVEIDPVFFNRTPNIEALSFAIQVLRSSEKFDKMHGESFEHERTLDRFKGMNDIPGAFRTLTQTSYDNLIFAYDYNGQYYQLDRVEGIIENTRTLSGILAASTADRYLSISRRLIAYEDSMMIGALALPMQLVQFIERDLA